MTFVNHRAASKYNMDTSHCIKQLHFWHSFSEMGMIVFLWKTEKDAINKNNSKLLTGKRKQIVELPFEHSSLIPKFLASNFS